MDDKRVSTLELLEETLNLIHKIKKSAINARIKKAEARSANYRKALTSQIMNQTDRDKVILLSQNLKDNINSNMNNDMKVGNYSSMSDNKSTLRSSGYNMNNKTMSEYNNIHDFTPKVSPINTPINGNTEDTKLLRFSQNASSSSSLATPFMKTSQSTTQNIQKKDLDMSSPITTVILTLEDLKKEINEWWKMTDIKKKSNEDIREDYADYLTDKYMCQKLDLLTVTSNISSLITKVRKEVCRFIENFATEGTIDWTMIDELLQSCYELNQDSKSTEFTTNGSMNNNNNNNNNNMNKSMRTNSDFNIRDRYSINSRKDSSSSSNNNFITRTLSTDSSINDPTTPTTTTINHNNYNNNSNNNSNSGNSGNNSSMGYYDKGKIKDQYQAYLKLRGKGKIS